MSTPVLPYAGTSGWSGSDGSRERAEREDGDGTTKDRQDAVLAALHAEGRYGVTWRDMAAREGWHHGQASAALSVLHKDGVIARLAERRDRCHIYVLPKHVDGRDVEDHGGRRKPDYQPHGWVCDEHVPPHYWPGDDPSPFCTSQVQVFREVAA